jgi:hypothetical protein
MTTNEQLQTFLALKQEIAKLEKQLAPLKKTIEAMGSFETDEFSVEIKLITQHRVVGCEDLIEHLGVILVEEKGLIKESSYNKLNVIRKETAARAA